MKYIRTKDELGYKDENGFYCFRLWFTTTPREDLIIKEADTIEELCDEFVRVKEDIHDFMVSDDIPTKKFDDTEIYGAIWVATGLKYVAKMNEKGELELL